MSKDYAIIAGGCFWCTEAVFENVDGVVSVYPGYIGGKNKNPSYEEVCTGNTGHAEAVKIEFELAKISYEKILDIFFKTHDPTTLNKQGNDIGTQYRSCIMPINPNQLEIAKQKIAEMQPIFDNRIVTTIEEPINFTIAEDYHHDYYARNPTQGYCMAVVGPKIAKIRKKFAHLH